MVNKGNLAIDPRGLIFESYRMEGIGIEECRTIFLDWALGTPLGADMAANLSILMAEYGDGALDHPMTEVLREGLDKAEVRMGRRGGAMGRR
ncbi:MAG: hypothetical protein GY947_03555 [Rhodobacteraceae bacterium]|nr:hypothetical protein [Paracoccaceae bacterium]